jgi:D-alanine-D-alanine ligase
MKIGITYDLKEDYQAAYNAPDDLLEEYDTEETVSALAAEIGRLGHEAIRLGSGTRCSENLIREQVDMVFNIAEGNGGRSRESQVPALLELLNIPYVGSDTLTLALSLDKGLTKIMARSEGIDTPPFFVIRDHGDIERLKDVSLLFPVIAKPLREGSSMGIRGKVKLLTMEELIRRVEYLLETYRTPVLVEEFIRGVDVTVGVIGNGHEAKIIGTMVILPRKEKPENFVYSIEAKRNWREEVEYRVDPTFKMEISQKICVNSLKIFRHLGCRDMARVDFRVDLGKEIPYFLEINPLPGLNPQSGDLPIMAQLKGIEYKELINSILDSALRRFSLEGRYCLQSA